MDTATEAITTEAITGAEATTEAIMGVEGAVITTNLTTLL
jgi:hypothetical protein